jgi:hypothetical protein
MPTHLHTLEFLEALLYQFLYLPLIVHAFVFPERIACSPFGVFPEVVCRELAALP